ncbi:glycoside hydrolase family 73 protein [Cohnella faecalis]|uniref:Muramidase (Flagellum-specific) n=1 Tax=Cohnella faecalis TaxID=2315694 RepID=A0A398CV50_9BACL|nr:glucosaminidase domain-containing protein [Cohnella faecalis]RIE04428.1 muramidase (flagellum-specific) [Cohnella faecalis]
MDRKTFFEKLAPSAVRAREEGSPMFASVRLAQNWLETGGVINKHNNLGGLKAGSGTANEWWKGDTYTAATWEMIGGERIETIETWRSYGSIHDFYRDQDRLLRTSRYARVRAARTPEIQAEALWLCGYATDPAYSTKLIEIMNRNGLKKYDSEKEDEPMTKEEKEAFEALVKRVVALEEEKRLPAPEWFIAEFGSADLGGAIRDPRGTPDFWRAVGVVIRAARKGLLK